MCDQCKWDHRSACHDPRRPNVKWDEECKEYCWVHSERPFPRPSAGVPPAFGHVDWSLLREGDKENNKAEAEVDYRKLAQGFSEWFDDNSSEWEE